MLGCLFKAADHSFIYVLWATMYVSAIFKSSGSEFPESFVILHTQDLFLKKVNDTTEGMPFLFPLGCLLTNFQLPVLCALRSRSESVDGTAGKAVHDLHIGGDERDRICDGRVIKQIPFLLSYRCTGTGTQKALSSIGWPKDR